MGRPPNVGTQDYPGPPLSTVWNALDNREKALIFWVVVLIVAGLWMRVGREFVRTTAGILWSRLGLILLVYVAYVAAVISALAWAGLWMTEVAVATAFWFAGPGMVMFFSVNQAATNKHFLRDLLRRGLWLLLGVEFVVNFFPFSLPVEIVLVPVLAFIALFGALPRGSPGAAGAKKFSEIVLALFALGLILRFVWLVATDWDDFSSSETVARFWVPPALTVAVLPFFYVAGVYMLYELAFVRLRLFMRDDPLLGYAKRAFVRRFKLRLGELREKGSGPLQVAVARAGGKEEIDAVLRQSRGSSRWKAGGKQPPRTEANADA
jgi:hypothetical protein